MPKDLALLRVPLGSKQVVHRQLRLPQARTVHPTTDRCTVHPTAVRSLGCTSSTERILAYISTTESFVGYASTTERRAAINSKRHDPLRKMHSVRRSVHSDGDTPPDNEEALSLSCCKMPPSTVSKEPRVAIPAGHEKAKSTVINHRLYRHEDPQTVSKTPRVCPQRPTLDGSGPSTMKVKVR
jgi:hypothetical protein